MNLLTPLKPTLSFTLASLALLIGSQAQAQAEQQAQANPNQAAEFEPASQTDNSAQIESDPLHTDSSEHAANLPEVVTALPTWFENAPQLLPKESSHMQTPTTQSTKDNSYIDQKQYEFSGRLDSWSEVINSWFGESESGKPATASLRLILDQRLDENQDYAFDARVRGKIRLPALEEHLSLVFGDDSLDDELNPQKSAAALEPSTLTEEKTTTAENLKRSKEDNSSVALRFSSLADELPFQTDFDLGVRSGSDVYSRLKLDKTLNLAQDYFLYTAQIYRYGLESEHYFQTNLELAYAPKLKPLIANHFKVVMGSEAFFDVELSNRLFRQHRFFNDHRFNYGLYNGGYHDAGKLRHNSWGPFVSWRQPAFREWFFVQLDTNYFNNLYENQSHEPSVLLRLEAMF